MYMYIHVYHVVVSVVLRDIIGAALSAQPPGTGRESFQVRRSGALSEETWYDATMQA